jgi:hypothetical protein
VTQHSDRHLTTEQLSALLDEQLFGEERAACEAHLRGCQQCRSQLADLRQTVALLHALPEPELPRSFTLPNNLTYLRERAAPAVESRPVSTATIARQRRPTPLKRPLRILSTLVAVIGLFFLVSSVITMLPHSGTGASSTMNTAAPAAAPSHTSQKAPASGGSKPQAAQSSTMGPAQRTATAAASPTPAPTPTTSESAQTPPGAHLLTPPPPSSPLPDLNTPLGLSEVGVTLLVLGILGLIFTRRRQHT